MATGCSGYLQGACYSSGCVAQFMGTQPGSGESCIAYAIFRNSSGGSLRSYAMCGVPFD